MKNRDQPGKDRVRKEREEKGSEGHRPYNVTEILAIGPFPCPFNQLPFVMCCFQLSAVVLGWRVVGEACGNVASRSPSSPSEFSLNSLSLHPFHNTFRTLSLPSIDTIFLSLMCSNEQSQNQWLQKSDTLCFWSVDQEFKQDSSLLGSIIQKQFCWGWRTQHGFIICLLPQLRRLGQLESALTSWSRGVVESFGRVTHILNRAKWKFLSSLKSHTMR